MEVPGKIRRRTKKNAHKAIVLCDLCRGENEDENAEFYCTLCNEHLCAACAKAHRRTRLTKGHPLLDRDSMPEEKLPSCKEEVCLNHTDKLVEYYCNVHNVFICTVCATLEHNQCVVEYIEELETDFEESKEYKSILKEIKTLCKLIRKTKKKSEESKESAQDIHREFISEVKNFRTEINKILDNLEKAALQDAERITDTDVRSADTAITTCDTLLSEINEMSSNMKRQKVYKRQRQLVISAKTALPRIKQYKYEANELSKQNTIQRYTFQPNANMLRFVQSVTVLGELECMHTKGQPISNEEARALDQPVATTSEVKDVDQRAIAIPVETSIQPVTTNSEVRQIGKPVAQEGTTYFIDTTKNKGNPTQGQKVTTENKVGDVEEAIAFEGSATSDRLVTTEKEVREAEQAIVHDEDPALEQPIKMRFISNINIEHSSDFTFRKRGETPYITGGVMISTDRLVLADRANCSVKVVDVNKESVVSCLRLSGSPWGISCFKKGQLVVACDGGLIILKVDTTLSIVKGLVVATLVDIRGIVYTNNTFVATFDLPKSSVEILDLEGKTLKTFSTDNNGKALFCRPLYIALSQDQKTAFVSDIENKNVTSIRLDGTVLSVYAVDLTYATGLFVDGDSIYVAGSSTIHELQSSVGGELCLVRKVKRAVFHPYAIVFVKSNGMLYMGQWSPCGVDENKFVWVMKLVAL